MTLLTRYPGPPSCRNQATGARALTSLGMLTADFELGVSKNKGDPKQWDPSCKDSKSDSPSLWNLPTVPGRIAPQRRPWSCKSGEIHDCPGFVLPGGSGPWVCNHPEVDRLWVMSEISYGSFKDHLLSTPGWLYTHSRIEPQD